MFTTNPANTKHFQCYTKFCVYRGALILFNIVKLCVFLQLDEDDEGGVDIPLPEGQCRMACDNGGMCQLQANGPVCVCTDQYDGDFCGTFNIMQHTK